MPVVCSAMWAPKGPRLSTGARQSRSGFLLDTLKGALEARTLIIKKTAIT